MINGTFIISREELAEQLFSQHIYLSSSIPIYTDDRLTVSIGFTDEQFNQAGELVCHVEEQIFDKYFNEELEYRFGYELNINDDGSRCIELTYVNLVSR